MEHVSHRLANIGHLRIFVVAILALSLAEMLWRLYLARMGYDIKGALASLVIGIGNRFAGAFDALMLFGIYAAVGRFAPVHWSISDWRVWVVGFVLVEFMYYWSHRFSHAVRWMWATHAVHHTPEEITFLSAVRLGWTNFFSLNWLFRLPLILAGFDPRMIATWLVIDLHYQFFLHTESIRKLGPLEWVLNTPAHHRVHHASNEAYIDCNFGGMVIVFDRLFGTFREESENDRVRYGLAHPFGTQNPLVMVFGEWRRLFADMFKAGGWRGALKVALGKP